MITNYPLIWGEGTKKGTNWESMCLNQGRTLGHGEIKWKNKPPGEDYCESICLVADYNIEWIDYTPAGFQEVFDNGRIKHPFKYLVVEV